jgi:MOSC domain-containing protein YiiM
MGKVILIGISKNHNSPIANVMSVEAIKGKGLMDEKHFKKNNEKRCQITLIEIENINHYNKITGTMIPAINFLRNIVTEGIQLNVLVGKEFFIGTVKVKAHDLCRPCKYLQESVQQKNTVKELLHTGGLRCEILSSGKICVDDQIIS